MPILRYLMPLAASCVLTSLLLAVELVEPLDDAPRFELSNLRQEKDRFGGPSLLFDFKQIKGGSGGVYFVKGASSQGHVSVSAALPSFQKSGTMTLTSFIPPRGNPKVNIELFVTQMHTVGDKKYVYSMVSNTVRLGDPGKQTRPRPWTAEERAGYEKVLREKPLSIKRYEVTTAIPTTTVKVPNTAKLVSGTKLQACYQDKWSPITTLKENEDGSVRVRWDEWGEKYDCNMLRQELVIAKSQLGKLEQHPKSKFPDVHPSMAGTDNASASAGKSSSPPSASSKPLKEYPVSIAVPADSQFVPADAQLAAETKLQACYASSWNPITFLSHSDDGTLLVRWDDYGPSFDCRMHRKQLIVKKIVLANQPSDSKAAQTARIWTDATGKFKVNAKLLKHDAAQVTLQTEAGKEVVLPIGRLSQADQDYLKSLAEPSTNPFE